MFKPYDMPFMLSSIHSSHCIVNVSRAPISRHSSSAIIALKEMGQDFLNSYIKIVDGEKDPRNLMMLFAMDRVILLEFDVEPLIEVCLIS